MAASCKRKRKEVGAKKCQKGPSDAKKKAVFTNDLGPYEMPKQLFLARSYLMVVSFGPPKMPKCLDIGMFGDEIWVKGVSKM